MSKDSGLLEGTPYSGLQRKILQDIARKKSKLTVDNSKTFEAHVKKGKDANFNNNDESIKDRTRDSVLDKSNIKSATSTKRKISDISPQQANESSGSEINLLKKSKIISTNDSQKEKDKRDSAKSSKSNGSASNNGASNSASSDSKYSNDRTIYIQGLPFSATEDEVRKLFESCGTIVSIRLPRWHDSGRIKGYGHVEFNDSSSATKALDLSGEYIQDRYITVDRPQTPRSVQAAQESGKVVVDKPVGCRRIFVKNLPYEVAEEDIREAFKVFGPITNIRLAMWGHTGNLKGSIQILLRTNTYV